MNKIVTLAAMAAMLATSAAAGTKYRLSKISDSFYAVTMPYEWDEQNRVVRSGSDLGNNPYFHTITYNEAGDIIRDACEVSYDGGETYKPSYYYEYEYDASRKLIKRTGYNRLQSNNYEPSFSGLMRWEYDEQGRPSARYTYFSMDADAPFAQLISYSYDDKGRLSRIEDHMNDLSNNTWSTNFLEYTYDEKDRVVDIAGGSLSDMALVVNRHTFFVYDENDNLTSSYVTGTNVNVKQSLDEYFYTDVPAEDVIYPYTIEEDMVLENSVFGKMTHQVELRIQSSPTNDGEMLPLYEWEYTYEEVKEDGIESISFDDSRELEGVRMDGGRVYITGLADGTPVAVYDLSGRKVIYIPSSSGESFDVDHLSAGVYVVATPSGSARFVR